MCKCMNDCTIRILALSPYGSRSSPMGFLGLQLSATYDTSLTFHEGGTLFSKQYPNQLIF